MEPKTKHIVSNTISLSAGLCLRRYSLVLAEPCCVADAESSAQCLRQQRFRMTYRATDALQLLEKVFTTSLAKKVACQS